MNLRSHFCDKKTDELYVKTARSLVLLQTTPLEINRHKPKLIFTVEIYTSVICRKLAYVWNILFEC